MPSRTFHNLVNAAFFGFSGNDIHQFMDRAAKRLRQKHRQVGHDSKALAMMLLHFQDKYTPDQIIKTFMLHKYLDSLFSGIQETVRSKVKGYGVKDSTLEGIKKLAKEIFR